MTLEEWLRDEREEGRREGERKGTLMTLKTMIFEFLKPLGIVSEELRNSINELDDEESLKILAQKAAKADSLEAFEKDAGHFSLW